MAFQDSFLDELTASTDIVELISRHVDLKKRGDGYWGLCPFHGEKTPSFHVLPDRGIFHCFGCGVGGGPIQFLQRLENMTFHDAVSVLADRAGIVVPQDASDLGGKIKRDIYDINRRAAHWFHGQLKAPGGSAARAYISSRGLTPAIVTRFGLGWAPDGWDVFTVAMKSEGFTLSDLCAAGLAVSRKDGGAYDRFRGRLIFPIIDIRGRVIAFGGRTLGDGSPKYLNSPETPVFSKSRHLFALPFAKNAAQGRIILAEGYMDVVSLHQAGFTGAVASLGTALTAQQAALISKYAKEVVIAFDTDAAGAKAAERAIGVLESSGITVRVLQLEGAKDPDEYIRVRGREAFAAVLRDAAARTDYRLTVLARGSDLTGDEGRLRFCREAAALLGGLESEAERAIYTRKAALMCGIPEDALAADVSKAREKLGRQMKKQTARRSMLTMQDTGASAQAGYRKNARAASAEEGIIRLVYADPSLIGYASRLLSAEDFSVPLLGSLFDWAVANPENPEKVFSAEGRFGQDELSRLAAIMHKPVSFEAGRQALNDCVGVVMEERTLSGADQTSDEALMRLRQSKMNS